MKDQTKITVAISMITYNHEKYIAKAIEGVLAQQTNFRYQLFITEDKSPDNTATVCRDFQIKNSDLIDLEVFEKNIGGNANWIHNLKKCKQSGAKYIATCEGDDYWIDPLKLQKQVDFLYANLDCGMVHTNLHEHNTSKKSWRKNIWSDRNFFQEGDIFNSLLIGRTSMIYTPTACFRTSLIDDVLNDHLSLNLAMGDAFMWLTIANKSKIGYLPSATAVRQILENSATQGLEYIQLKHFIDSGNKLINYFLSKRNIDKETLTLAKKSNALRYLELFQRYKKKDEFKKSYSIFRKEYFEMEAKLSKMATRGKIPYYFSRVISKMLLKLKLDFKSKVHRKLSNQGLLVS